MSEELLTAAKLIAEHKQVLVDNINSASNRVRYNFNEQLKNENLEKLSLIENIILVYQQVADMRSAAQAKIAQGERDRVNKLLRIRQQDVNAELDKVEELEDTVGQKRLIIQQKLEAVKTSQNKAYALKSEIQQLQFCDERAKVELDELNARKGVDSTSELELCSLLSDMGREAEMIASSDLIHLRQQRLAVEERISLLQHELKQENERREVERAAFQIAIKQQQADCEEIADRIRSAMKASESSRPVSPLPQEAPPADHTHESPFHHIGIRSGLHKGLKMLLPLLHRHSSPTRTEEMQKSTSAAATSESAASLVIEQQLSHEVHQLADHVAWYEHQREILRAFASSPGTTVYQLVVFLMKVPELVEGEHDR